MHKSIDFSQPGGYPFDQDTLDFLQNTYKDVFTQVGKLGVSGSTPSVINGMAVTNSGNTVANGWFIYGGEIIPFTGSTVTPSGGQVALVLISTTATPLNFDDGSTPSVIITKTASLIAGASVTDATHFPVSSMISWQQGLGLNGRESAFTTININLATGAITGTLQYRKNLITNQLHYKLSIAVATPSALTDAPTSALSLLATLPAGYIPSSAHNVMAAIAVTSAGPVANSMLLLNVGGYVNSFRLFFGTDGGVSVFLNKPDASVILFNVYSSGVIGLD